MSARSVVLRIQGCNICILFSRQSLSRPSFYHVGVRSGRKRSAKPALPPDFNKIMVGPWIVPGQEHEVKQTDVSMARLQCIQEEVDKKGFCLRKSMKHMFAVSRLTLSKFDSSKNQTRCFVLSISHLYLVQRTLKGLHNRAKYLARYSCCVVKQNLLELAASKYAVLTSSRLPGLCWSLQSLLIVFCFLLFLSSSEKCAAMLVLFQMTVFTLLHVLFTDLCKQKCYFCAET